MCILPPPQLFITHFLSPAIPPLLSSLCFLSPVSPPLYGYSLSSALSLSHSLPKLLFSHLSLPPLLHVCLNLIGQITDVGALAAGTSVVTFYIINATDQEAPPTFVPSATVLAAIEARNITQVLTYPVRPHP